MVRFHLAFLFGSSDLQNVLSLPERIEKSHSKRTAGERTGDD